MARIFKILSPTAILGYGFPEESPRKATEELPDFIAIDAGSSDPGPHYLGAGKPFTDRASVRRDLRYTTMAGIKNNVSVVVGAAGGSGAASHPEWCRQIIHEIVQEEKLSFSMVLILSDADKEVARQTLDNGGTIALDFAPELIHETIEGSIYIVAQMGIEPFQRALKAGAQVALGGRAYDPVCFAALPIMQGLDENLALHCGKIPECTAVAVTPGSGSDYAMGIVDDNGFTPKAFNPKCKLTEASAAARTLYEELDPYFLPGPDGVLSLKACILTQVNEGGVYVSGSRHEETPYVSRLEGAHQVGSRCLIIAGTRDPVIIAGTDTILEEVQASVVRNLPLNDDSTRMTFHLYGKNGVMGNHEPMKAAGHELGISLDVVAPIQDIANSVCSLVHSILLHCGYGNRIAAAGNPAFLLLPSGTQSGPVYELSIYHLIEVSDVLRFDFHIGQVTSEGIQA